MLENAALSHCVRCVGLALALAAALGSPHARAERGLTAVASRTSEPPVIDGALNEAVWASAEPIRDFVQLEPVLGASPSDPTEVRILYDADYLYIGARLHDHDPTHIVTT